MKRLFPYILVLIISIGTIIPLFSSGFFPMHDDAQVARVYEMGQALRGGQFPVRMINGLGYGYGYPLFNFYGPLPYYVGGILSCLGMDAVVATKIVMGVGMLGAALSMFAFASYGYGLIGGMISAIAFVYVPYHAVQLYVRGAVGELWATMFLPLVLFGFFLIHDERTEKIGISIGGLSIAAAILSHTVYGYCLILMIFFGLILYWAIGIFRHTIHKREFGIDMIVVLIGLGLSSFFWLPALLEMGYTDVAKTIGNSADFHNHFVCVQQLWSSSWGFGGSAPGCQDGMSLKIGKIQLVFSLAAFALAILLRKKNSRYIPMFTVGVICAIGALFFLLPLSTIVWEHIPYMAFIQYPWRWLIVLCFGCTLSAGYLGTIGSKKIQIGIGVLCTVGVIISCYRLFVPQYTYMYEPGQLTSLVDIQGRASRVSDEYLHPDINRPLAGDAVKTDLIQVEFPAEITILRNTETFGDISIQSDQKQKVTIRKSYFPGWKLFVGGNEVQPEIVGGFPVISIPAGLTHITVHFTNTPVRTVANVLSISTILLLVLLIYGKKSNR